MVGTPHISPAHIALYSAVLGYLETNTELPEAKRQKVTHNGFEFSFTTYDDEKLRAIQFYFIESNLRQAIGRARPYSESCTVKVLSNYPLPEAHIIGADKVKGAQIDRQTVIDEIQCAEQSVNEPRSHESIQTIWQADLGDISHAESDTETTESHRDYQFDRIPF